MSARDAATWINVSTIVGIKRTWPYVQQNVQQSDTDYSIATQKLYAHPLVIGENTPTIAQVGFWVSQANSVMVRIGLYAKTSSSNLWPGALLLDVGTMSVQSLGPWANSVSFVASANDLLWVAYVTSFGANLVQFRSAAEPFGPLLGLDATLQAERDSVSVTYASMTLPATFPTSQTALANVAAALVRFR